MRVYVLFVFSLFCFSLTSCSPSKGTILNTVEQTINEYGCTGGSENVKQLDIELLELVEKGVWKNDRLMVKVKVKASITTFVKSLGKLKRCSIDDIYEFKIFKDEYGNWKAHWVIRVFPHLEDA